MPFRGSKNCTGTYLKRSKKIPIRILAMLAPKESLGRLTVNFKEVFVSLNQTRSKKQGLGSGFGQNPDPGLCTLN